MKKLLVLIAVSPIGSGSVEAQTSAASDGGVRFTKRAILVTPTRRRHVPVLQHRNQRYQLHSADVLQLTFPYTPEFNQNVTVQPDGYISLRGAEDIHVQGQTLRKFHGPWDSVQPSAP